MHRSLASSTSFALATVAAAFIGCAGGGQDGQIQLAIKGADQIALFNLTTANTKPAGAADVVAAVVTINEIDARVGKTWTPVMTTPHTIDLLKLDGKTLDTLGIASLPMGHINELRLKLDEIGAYVVLKSGVKKPLEIENNGVVAVTGHLDLDACVAGIVILDFDPKIKIEDEGSHREYELRAHATLKTDELKGGCGDMAGAHPDLAGGDMSKPAGDMASSDMAGGGCVCPMGQVCQAGHCVADPCDGVVCPMGQVCQVVGGNPVCGAPSDMGGCHKK